LALLVTIPVIIFTNQHSTTHGVQSQKRLKARSVAEEGIAFAIQQMTANGNLNCPTNFNGTTPLQSAQGNTFTLNCAIAPENYQRTLTAVPKDSQGNVIPGSSVLAVVSQKTVSVNLPTGLAASAALDMAQVPLASGGGALEVELGPAVCRDALLTDTWLLGTVMDSQKRPRKFSAGPISPRCISPTPPTTDQKEYWAYTSPGFASVIDLNSYQTNALATTCTVPPTCTPISCSLVGGCLFTVPAGETAVFGAGFVSPTTPNSVIYVEGNATLQQPITLNLSNGGNGGAFIVDGTTAFGGGALTLGDGDANATGYSPFIRIPPTAALDDPYQTCGVAPAACNGTTTRNLDFQGFLYTNGSLNITPGVSNPYWTLDGVVRVDGPLTVNSVADVLIYYNDLVNHSIQTSNFEIQVDSTTAIQ
jgi:hypothetical protein